MEKTPVYDLSQWEKSDRILMEDFNADNANLEAALSRKLELVELLEVTETIQDQNRWTVNFDTFRASDYVMLYLDYTFPYSYISLSFSPYNNISTVHATFSGQKGGLLCFPMRAPDTVMRILPAGYAKMPDTTLGISSQNFTAVTIFRSANDYRMEGTHRLRVLGIV